jgi:CheY-like chemotaxis protein
MAPLVLIVDDDQEAARAEGLLLRVGGFEAAPVTRAEDALTMLRGGLAPAVVVVDLMLGGMDGNAFVKELRGLKNHELGIVIVTGWTQMLQPETAAMADAVLAKPLEGTELLRAVRAVAAKLGKGDGGRP